VENFTNAPRCFSKLKPCGCGRISVERPRKNGYAPDVHFSSGLTRLCRWFQ
jgi:hypothetical protein